MSEHKNMNKEQKKEGHLLWKEKMFYRLLTTHY